MPGNSDVASDVCWVDMTADQRKALTRTQKDSQCKCLGVNAMRQSSCNFPSLGQYYDPAIDAQAPVKPADPGPQLAIITVFFAGTVIAQKCQDVR